MATKREKDILNNLDKRMAVLEDTIDRLETNHLSHLQKQIDKIESRGWGNKFGVCGHLAGILTIFMVGIK